MTDTGEQNVRKYEATLKLFGLIVVALAGACGAYLKATSEAGDIAVQASEQTATARKEASSTAEAGYATLAKAVSNLQAEVKAYRKDNEVLRDELVRKGVLKNGTRPTRPRIAGVGGGIGHGAGGSGGSGGAGGAGIVLPLPPPPAMREPEPEPEPTVTHQNAQQQEQRALPPTIQEALQQYKK